MNIEEQDIHDFQNITISALRYALGRRTYLTDVTAEFIKKYPNIIDERVCCVMLRDIDRYMIDRKIGFVIDDKCDYDTWLNLQNWLFDLAKEKNFNVIVYEVR